MTIARFKIYFKKTSLDTSRKILLFLIKKKFLFFNSTMRKKIFSPKFFYSPPLRNPVYAIVPKWWKTYGSEIRQKNIASFIQVIILYCCCKRDSFTNIFLAAISTKNKRTPVLFRIFLFCIQNAYLNKWVDI